MVYAGGHISGGHYNPAVSLAVWVRGRLASRDLLLYWAAQLVGALLGAVLAHFLIDTRANAQYRPGAMPRWCCSPSSCSPSVATTVMAGAIAVGPLTGGALNPAVVAGGWVIGLFSGSSIWLYLLATLLADATAGGAFCLLNPADLGPARSKRAAPVRGANEVA